jgi:Transposase IS66 family
MDSLAELEAWLRELRSRMSRSASVAGPIDYMLKRWDWFAGFIGDGRVCLTNNGAERALRGGGGQPIPKRSQLDSDRLTRGLVRS